MPRAASSGLDITNTLQPGCTVVVKFPAIALDDTLPKEAVDDIFTLQLRLSSQKEKAVHMSGGVALDRIMMHLAEHLSGLPAVLVKSPGDDAARVTPVRLELPAKTLASAERLRAIYR